MNEAQLCGFQASYQAFLRNVQNGINLLYFKELIRAHPLLFNYHTVRCFPFHDPLVFALVRRRDLLIYFFSIQILGFEFKNVITGDTVLHEAAARGTLDCFIFLYCNKGFGLYDQNKEGWTPLDMAIFHENMPIVKHYLEDLKQPLPRPLFRTPFPSLEIERYLYSHLLKEGL
jgi:hypothetical protein